MTHGFARYIVLELDDGRIGALESPQKKRGYVGCSDMWERILLIYNTKLVKLYAFSP